MAYLGILALLIACLGLKVPFAGGQDLPSSFPQVYPGQPDGDFSPEWQDYFLVDSSELPNITFPLSRSFAGNIPVNRPNHPNNTLYFWAFEKSDGSLTGQSTDPWLIWLQGGPGGSSLGGLIFENGPMRFQADSSFKPENHSWDRLVDSFWVDQPVGVGYATADSTGYVADDDQMAADFLEFLSNLVKVFPSLATRPLHLTGESYAGRWIPYIARALFSTTSPPVKLAKIAIGDAAIGTFDAFEDVPVISVIETFPQLVSYDPEVLEYFHEQQHLCGYDFNFTYPQDGFFPSLQPRSATDPASPYFFTEDSGSTTTIRRTGTMAALQRQRTLMRYARSLPAQEDQDRRMRAARGEDDARLNKREREREEKRTAWKRDLSLRSNGTIDSWYGCFLFDELLDYAVNYTFPWNVDADGNAINVYDTPDALFPKPADDIALFPDVPFFNDDRTRTALHAPTSKNWSLSIRYPFINTLNTGDPSPEAQVFFNELAKNASDHGVGIVLYSGNNDALVAHRSTELVIQNTTFGGIQGFTQKPSTPWYDDDDNFAGIIHQERGWTYVLFQDASHLVPNSKPAAAYAFLRDYVLGNKTLGLVQTDANGEVSVEGGQESTLAGNFLPPETAAVYYGSLATQSTLTYPSATVAVWDSAVASLEAATTSASGAKMLLGCGFGGVTIVFFVSLLSEFML